MWYLILLCATVFVLQMYTMLKVYQGIERLPPHQMSSYYSDYKRNAYMVSSEVLAYYYYQTTARRIDLSVCGDSFLVLVAHLALVAKGVKMKQALAALGISDRATLKSRFPLEINQYYQPTQKRGVRLWMESRYLCYENCQQNEKFLRLANRHFNTEGQVIRQNCFNGSDRMATCETRGHASHFITLSSYALFNAVHIMGLWQKPFLPEAQFHTKFLSNAGDRVVIEYMTMEDNFLYHERPEGQVMMLLCQTPDLALMTFLPRGSDLGPFILRYKNSFDIFHETLSKLKLTRLRVTMPKMNSTNFIDVTPSLKKLIPSLFQNGTYPGLSGVFGVNNRKNVDSSGDFILNKVWQINAFILNENGFEASINSDMASVSNSYLSHPTSRRRVPREAKPAVKQIEYSLTRAFIYCIVYKKTVLMWGLYAGRSNYDLTTTTTTTTLSGWQKIDQFFKDKFG